MTTAEDGDTTLDFYLTAELPCPYLDGLEERRVLTLLDTPAKSAALPLLLQSGFRRSQNMVYRPQCRACSACRSVRLRLADFTPDAGLRRILRKNENLHTAESPAKSSPALFDLFRRYQHSRHADGEMAQMTEADFAAMLEQHTGHARMMTVFDTQKNPAGAMLYDDLPEGVSAVYSFFDPALSAQSPGTWMILQLAAQAAQAGKDYLYLGYWIAASRKMAYKARFQPLEVFHGSGWEDLAPPSKDIISR
ncbi:MAG: arginyltransferase [Alphaproteobacteria bacterium]|nr:arginyltransferase [Alphaproteobacteria bacterium]